MTFRKISDRYIYDKFIKCLGNQQAANEQDRIKICINNNYTFIHYRKYANCFSKPKH